MAFLIPRNPLNPSDRLALRVDPTRAIVRAAELAVWRQAEEAMSAAKAQAAAIVEAAQAAYEAERKRGYQAGVEQAQSECAQHIAEQTARVDEYFTDIQHRLVDVVMQAVRKIVGEYDDRERVVLSVRNALAIVRNQKQITLRLHPGHVEHVKARTTELLSDYPGVGLLDVMADNRLAPGTCVLESDIGMVEASTDVQLAAIEAAFRQVPAVHA